jgi:hypothetical protein
MKEYVIKFKMDDDDILSVTKINDGFSGHELIALLEIAKADVIAQLSPDLYFKRTFIDQEGNKYDVKGENE